MQKHILVLTASAFLWCVALPLRAPNKYRQHSSGHKPNSSRARHKAPKLRDETTMTAT
jgi:hypothetical protein